MTVGFLTWSGLWGKDNIGRRDRASIGHRSRVWSAVLVDRVVGQARLVEGVLANPAVTGERSKYVLPLRDYNSEVFFDHGRDPNASVMMVLCRDRHGLVLDVVSVLIGLGLRVVRVCDAEADCLPLLFQRMETELVELAQLGISTENVLAFFITEEDGSKVECPDRLAWIETMIKRELSDKYPRPQVANENWHRVWVHQNRGRGMSSVSFSNAVVFQLDSLALDMFARAGVEVMGSSVKSGDARTENTYFVTQNGKPLSEDRLFEVATQATTSVLSPLSTSYQRVWYQARVFPHMAVAEAIVLDGSIIRTDSRLVNWEKYETPNFRGRLPDLPYTRM